MNPNESHSSVSEQSEQDSKTGPLQISVTEKVIFCIDSMVLFNEDDGNVMITSVFKMLDLYMTMKRKISISPVYFHCLLFHNNALVTGLPINNCNDLHEALMSLSICDSEVETRELQSFNFNALFDNLVNIVELPDHGIYGEFLPPPHVYHVIFLFGRNVHLPIMTETNAFNFLIQSPFFALDTMYIYNSELKGNKHREILKALDFLHKRDSNYFFFVSHKNISEQLNIFAQLLGHPLIRCPQNKLRHDVFQYLWKDQDVAH